MTFRNEIRSLLKQKNLFKDEINVLSSRGCNVKFCPDEALKDYEKDTENGIPSYSCEYTVLYAYKEIQKENEVLDIHIELILTAPECNRYWDAHIISSVPDRISGSSYFLSSSLIGHLRSLSLESLLRELDEFLKEDEPCAES